MRIESTVLAVAAALLLSGCFKRPMQRPELIAIERGLPKWLGEETKLAWAESGGSGGDRKSYTCAYDFTPMDPVAMPNFGGADRDVQRERWFRSQVDGGTLLQSIRKRVLAALLSNGCRQTGTGGTGSGAFSIKFESDRDVGAVEVAAYETARNGVTIHLYMWEADR